VGRIRIENVFPKIGSFLLVLGLSGLCNWAGLYFEIAKGVSLFFPAAAVVVAGALLFRWWGVAGALLGFLLTPWGLSTTPGRILFFALAAVSLGVIPLLARKNSTWPRCVHSLLWAAVFNTFFSALTGGSGILYLTRAGGTTASALAVFGSWFFGDMVAIILLAFPLVLILRPEILLDSNQEHIYRRWRINPLHWCPPVIGVLAVAGVMEMTRNFGIFHVHWLAAACLLPILMAAVTGGVGGALQINSLAGLMYLWEVIQVVNTQSSENLFREVFSSYLNLLVFGVASVSVGLVWGRSDALLRELEQHRRLLQDNFERVVTALAAAVEAKDPLTKGHVQRVARLAVAVGRKMGIEGRDLELLRYGALLHDVGKIGVSEAVLNKRGPLTPEEKEELEKHVTIGVEIIESVDILAPAIPLIRYHQERWDGRTDENLRYPGYFGRSGREIPLGARIIAVVDAWDAMTNDRPYRDALDRDVARAELRKESGAQFDPDVVDVLIEVFDEETSLESGERVPLLSLQTAAY